ncbi:NAD(P)/FAD-dependent oxidoreductase [Halobacillus kuroshimensis]|uniref:Ferredoxin--NADP reductase n=1 Tax=Halobacillus kuroshimensis TaxID=302481 RepID=A0ABS3E1H1_9BACI|nr:NAD(P)/FAD-dependent oxidoreductase [Halobacillus kuroshimensis]MBN8237338.1 NAD(P)/FAD-dependent oxidoreductase [Halobacillus kuroshimensis]
MEMYDVTIIGGGTTGMYAAFYSGMRGMKTKVIEDQPETGGKVSFFYPEKQIYDVGGFPGISGEELAANVEKQAQSIHPALVTGTKVKDFQKQEDGTFLLMTNDGSAHYTRTVLIASGLGTFQMQPLQVNGAAVYDGTQIHYTIKNKEQYKGLKTAVVSENRVGIDWALALEDSADEVTLINRGNAFKAVYEKDEEKLQASSVHVQYGRTIQQLKEEDGQMTGVILSDGTELSIDHLLVYEGLQMEKSVYDQWGIHTDKGRIPVETDMCTNIPGVFAAGDAVVYPSKTMLIASGFNEAMAAINSAATFLDPKAKTQVYSTVIYKYLDD